MTKLLTKEEIKKLQEDGQKLIFRTVEKREFTTFWKVTSHTYVYDITVFMKEHPGGPVCLERAVNTGNDTQYDYMLHSHRGREVWEKYLIGEKSPE